MPSFTLDRKATPVKDAVRKSVASIVSKSWKFVPKIYQDIPSQRLYVALTRFCNANCVFCTYQLLEKKDRVHMSEEIFEKVLLNIKEAGIQKVHLSPNLGEPTAVPRFIDKMLALREAGIKSIMATSNATFFDTIGVSRLLLDGPDIMNISFPGFDQEMYERVFRTPHYKRVRSNILEILRVNKSMGKPKEINLWLRPDIDLDEVLAFPEMEEVGDLADQVAAMTEVDGWDGLIKPEMLTPGFSLQKVRPKLTKRPCMEMYDLTVHPDGDMHLCPCRNIFNDPDFHIGNIREMSIRDAYLRRDEEQIKFWENGKIPKMCARCNMYNDPANAYLGRTREVVARRLG